MSIAFAAIVLLQVLSVRADENVALGLDFQPAGFGGVIKAATTTLPFGCTVYAAYVDDCESSTTSFDYLPASIEASCLCYDAKTSWDPTFFDSAILECASWASTASTAIYSGLHAHESFCSKQGDVRAAKTTGGGATTTKSSPSGSGSPATTPKPTSGTAVATGGSGITGCSNVAAAITSCEAATSGFIDLSGSQQASCVCYAGTTSWAPSVFDDQVHSCVTYLSTASPSRYSTYRSLESFCSNKGNVRTNTASVLTTAGSATRSVVILQTNPATPSIGSDTSSASITSTQAVVVVTVQASTSTPAPTKPSAGVSVKAERILVLLGLSFVVATLGACILL